MKYGRNFTIVFWKIILRIDILDPSYESGLRWEQQSLIDDKLTLVQVMAGCRQETSHYLGHVDPDLCCNMAFLS